MDITAPLVTLHSNFGTEFEVGLNFEYEGQMVDLNGTAIRMTVEEIKTKYSN